MSENIVQCQKTFFLCLLSIYTFLIASFHFFCQLIELGSKFGLHRAQFRIWLSEQQSPQNLRAWFIHFVRSPPYPNPFFWNNILNIREFFHPLVGTPPLVVPLVLQPWDCSWIKYIYINKCQFYPKIYLKTKGNIIYF